MKIVVLDGYGVNRRHSNPSVMWRYIPAPLPRKLLTAALMRK